MTFQPSERSVSTVPLVSNDAARERVRAQARREIPRLRRETEMARQEIPALRQQAEHNIVMLQRLVGRATR